VRVNIFVVVNGLFSAVRIRLVFQGTDSSVDLRQCATSQKAAGYIPGGVIGIFH
jgi:hypothetical protein